MATITLYKDKLNSVSSLINTMVSSVNNLDMQLGALKSTLQGVNSSTYNLDSAVENIRSSSQTEQEKADDLNKLSKEVDNFITVTVNRDQAAKEEINKAKEDFYTKYSYLKPECEKDFIEKVVDTVESAADWCCDHWEVIAAIAAVIVVAVVVCVLLGPEALVPLVLNIAKGVLQGALLGGALGGAFSAFMGGDIVKGIKEGALAGGALGALGAVGSACGCIIGCESAFGIVSGSIGRLTGGIATAMFDFDIVSMIGYKIDGENNKIYQINKECHSNQIYNFFQRGITAIAAFTGGMSSAMKCFIAGTVIATETGFARIEDVKPGDIVLSTNTDTMETGCKKVLEKYVRKTRELVHIIVGGKEIVSTPDHPYYVEGRGFVNACQLCIGSPLLDADGKILEVEQIYKEQLGKNEEVKVYNFQVEDWHTYHVGEMEVLVHNAEYESGIDSGLTQSQIEDIINTPKGSRPDPSSYLSQEYIDAHLAQFDDGVSVIQTEWAYSRYSETNGFVGVPDDNSLFVMPKNYCDDVIARANGNISIIEKELGFPEGYFSDGGGLIRIDAPNTSELNIRIPSGNETGANKLWIPGGKTSGGVPEAITNTIPLKDTIITRIDVD